MKPKALLRAGQTQGWWWNGIPDDGSVYAVTAYPLGRILGERFDVPEAEVEGVGVQIYRASGGLRAPLALGFDVRNRQDATAISVFVAKMEPQL